MNILLISDREFPKKKLEWWDMSFTKELVITENIFKKTNTDQSYPEKVFKILTEV